jgi:hypothetical protein
VRVLQLRRDLNLAPETLAIHAGGEVWWKNFDDDIPIQRALGRKKHSAHAAAGELALQLVG